MLPLSSCLEHLLMLELSELQFTHRECNEEPTKQQSDPCLLLPTPPGPCMNWTSHNVNNNNEYLERLTRTGPKRLHVLYKYILSKFNAYKMNVHTHARTHTQIRTCTHARSRAYTHTHTHTKRVCVCVWGGLPIQMFCSNLAQCQIANFNENGNAMVSQFCLFL